MKKIVNKLKYIFIIALFCGIVFFITRYYYSKQIQTVEIVKEIEVEKVIEKEVEFSGEAIQDNLENIGKLCTAEYSYTHVERADSSRQIKGIKIPLTTASFIYSYDGIIMAGIDFTRIQVDKNDIKKVITVTLPKVEILSSDIDQDSFELYDEKNNIFNPISVEDVAESFNEMKNSEEKKAIEKGLFEKAEANAVMLVKNFMYNSYVMGDYDIKVIFDSNK